MVTLGEKIVFPVPVDRNFFRRAKKLLAQDRQVRDRLGLPSHLLECAEPATEQVFVEITLRDLLLLAELGGSREAKRILSDAKTALSIQDLGEQLLPLDQDIPVRVSDWGTSKIPGNEAVLLKWTPVMRGFAHEAGVPEFAGIQNVVMAAAFRINDRGNLFTSINHRLPEVFYPNPDQAGAVAQYGREALLRHGIRHFVKKGMELAAFHADTTGWELSLTEDGLASFIYTGDGRPITFNVNDTANVHSVEPADVWDGNVFSSSLGIVLVHP